jgi:hypothetical protein
VLTLLEAPGLLVAALIAGGIGNEGDTRLHYLRERVLPKLEQRLAHLMSTTQRTPHRTIPVEIGEWTRNHQRYHAMWCQPGSALNEQTVKCRVAAPGFVTPGEVFSHGRIQRLGSAPCKRDPRRVANDSVEPVRGCRRSQRQGPVQRSMRTGPAGKFADSPPAQDLDRFFPASRRGAPRSLCSGAAQGGSHDMVCGVPQATWIRTQSHGVCGALGARLVATARQQDAESLEIFLQHPDQRVTRAKTGANRVGRQPGVTDQYPERSLGDRDGDGTGVAPVQTRRHHVAQGPSFTLTTSLGAGSGKFSSQLPRDFDEKRPSSHRRVAEPERQ